MNDIPVTVPAMNIKAFDIIRLPGVEIDMQVLITPHRKDGYTEILFWGKPYVFPDAQKILLIKKSAK